MESKSASTNLGTDNLRAGPEDTRAGGPDDSRAGGPDDSRAGGPDDSRGQNDKGHGRNYQDDVTRSASPDSGSGSR
jgi:hypothetical protein